MEAVKKFKICKDTTVIYSCNFAQIITLILLLIMQSVTLADTIYFPGSQNLDRLLKVHDAKKLRIDLIDHKKYLEQIIEHLDEWAFEEIKQITNEDRLSQLKVKGLERELNNSLASIRELEFDLSDNIYDIHTIKEKYNKLQEYIQKLSNHLDENSRETFKLLKNYYGDTFPNLSNLHDNVLYKLSVLYKQIEAKEKIILVDKCIEAIRNKEFDKAVLKFNIINDESKLTYIVKEAYEGNEDNFHLLLNFGNTFRNITQSFLVYTVLIYEMELNGQNKDGFKTIELIKSIKNEIIYQTKTVESTKKEALALERFLIKRLKFFSKDTFRKTVLSDKEKFNIKFFNDILILDEKILSEISFEIILDFFKDNVVNPIFGWIMESFSDIFETIFRNNLNDNTVFKLAYYIQHFLLLARKESFTDNSAITLGEILNKEMESYRNRLPESVRNLVFAENVCIKNFGLDEYLHTSNNLLNNNRYTVFTRKSNENERQQEEIWKFTRVHGNSYNIQSYLQNLAYLYTSDIDDSTEHKSEGHNVFTWLPPNDLMPLINLGIWQIEPVDNYCYIKNVLHDEYLYVSEETSHIVFTVNNEDKNINYFKWHIVNCTFG